VGTVVVLLVVLMDAVGTCRAEDMMTGSGEEAI